jgi:hypothetical protein
MKQKHCTKLLLLIEETAIIELTAKYPLDFDALIRAQDDLALAERRKRQLGDIISGAVPHEMTYKPRDPVVQKKLSRQEEHKHWVWLVRKKIEELKKLRRCKKYEYDTSR